MTSFDFDREEKRIADALDALDRALDVPALLPGIRQKLAAGATGTSSIRTRRRPMRLLIVAAALVAVLGLTAAAASLGGFDWLLKKANPPFGNVVKPIEQSVVSQGIKVTAVAAESSGDMAVLYVTMEDTEHLGRVTEDTDFSFDSMQGVQSMSGDQIYFDKETGIAAYQIRLGSPDTFDGQSISLHMSGLSYGQTDLGEIRMDVDLAKAAAGGEHIGQPYESSLQSPSESLTPGHLADIPGTKSAWVSAIGINHGYLAVQVGQLGTGKRTIAYYIKPYLLDADGNRVEPKQLGSAFQTDEQLHMINMAEKSAFRFNECYFAVDTVMLDSYTLCFKGVARNVIAGEWNLNVNFGSLQKGRQVTADVNVGKFEVKNAVLTVNPFGMTLTGYSAPDKMWGLPPDIKTVLETTKGEIVLKCTGGSRPDPNGPFEMVWPAASAIDIDSVIAVHIGDNRIELRH